MSYAGVESFPARGTWIEISVPSALPPEGAASFPARGTWIEISDTGDIIHIHDVVPREGNVD